MPRRPPGSREVMPSKRATGGRRGASFGPQLGVSVPISFGLPAIVVGIALLAAALTTDRALYWVAGGVILVLGAALFATGKRL